MWRPPLTGKKKDGNFARGNRKLGKPRVQTGTKRLGEGVVKIIEMRSGLLEQTKHKAGRERETRARRESQFRKRATGSWR